MNAKFAKEKRQVSPRHPLRNLAPLATFALKILRLSLSSSPPGICFFCCRCLFSPPAQPTSRANPCPRSISATPCTASAPLALSLAHHRGGGDPIRDTAFSDRGLAAPARHTNRV